MASWGVVAYLRVEKPRFLFLGGSTGIAAAADVATAASPVTSAARAGTFADYLSPGLPGDGRSCARPRRWLLRRLRGPWRGVRRLPPLGESSPPIALLLLFLARRRILRSRQGRESLLLAQPELLTLLFPALPLPDPLLLLARRPLLFSPLCCVRALRIEAWADRTMLRSRSPSVGDE
jgi:hypothetical protein